MVRVHPAVPIHVLNLREFFAWTSLIWLSCIGHPSGPCGINFRSSGGPAARLFPGGRLRQPPYLPHEKLRSAKDPPCTPTSKVRCRRVRHSGQRAIRRLARETPVCGSAGRQASRDDHCRRPQFWRCIGFFAGFLPACAAHKVVPTPQVARVSRRAASTPPGRNPAGAKKPTALVGRCHRWRASLPPPAATRGRPPNCVRPLRYNSRTGSNSLSASRCAAAA